MYNFFSLATTKYLFFVVFTFFFGGFPLVAPAVPPLTTTADMALSLARLAPPPSLPVDPPLLNKELSSSSGFSPPTVLATCRGRLVDELLRLVDGLTSGNPLLTGSQNWKQIATEKPSSPKLLRQIFQTYLHWLYIHCTIIIEVKGNNYGRNYLNTSG